MNSIYQQITYPKFDQEQIEVLKTENRTMQRKGMAKIEQLRKMLPKRSVDVALSEDDQSMVKQWETERMALVTKIAALEANLKAIKEHYTPEIRKYRKIIISLKKTLTAKTSQK